MRSKRIEKTIMESEYPCLKEYRDHYAHYIVLFTKPRTGVVVWYSKGDYEIGEYCENRWVEELFFITNDTVELTNK